MMKMPLPPSTRSLTVAAPIDVTATPIRAATVRERSPGERPFSRKAPPCASERSSDLEFGHFQAAAPHGWGMLQLAIRAQLGQAGRMAGRSLVVPRSALLDALRVVRLLQSQP